jgi:hypothetical protein
MPETVHRLQVTLVSIGKLARRGISAGEARQLIGNPKLLLRNVGRTRTRRELARRLLVGQTDGGRALTLVIERTGDSGTWLIVTGWEATGRERKMLRRKQ